MAALAERQARAIEFPYRCDGPGTGRSMQMSITALVSKGAMNGYLFQSTTLGQVTRAPLALFDFKHRPHRPERDRNPALVHMCSFCERICPPGRAAADPASWTADRDTAERVATTNYAVQHTICPVCDGKWVASIRDTAGPSDLTRRQRDVLALLVRGFPNKAISTKLDMSANTVKTHLRSIFRRLGVRNRTEATGEALRRWPGLLDARAP